MGGGGGVNFSVGGILQDGTQKDQALHVSSGVHSVVVFSVLIWDDTRKDQDSKFVLEFTFAQPAVAVRLRMDRSVKACSYVTFAFPTTFKFNTAPVVTQMVSEHSLCLHLRHH